MLKDLPASVKPVEESNKWIFSFGETTLTVDPSVGGRITSYRLGRDEVLTGPEVNPTNWGSTFWPSPQSAWGWPPPTEIDTDPYRATLQGNTLVLTGPTVASGGVAGLSMGKRISVSAEQAIVCLEYQITNHSAAACEVAGWEITRVPRDNLHFFPEGAPGDVKKFQDLLPLQSAGGVAWLQYDPACMDRDLLVGRDGSEGWMASVRGDLLFAKYFPEIPEGGAAPGEAEVFLFLNGENAYVEVEAQSAVQRLEPGESLRWPVLWAVRRLPADVRVGVGSSALVDFVRRVLA